jgi:hypothetical protein
LRACWIASTVICSTNTCGASNTTARTAWRVAWMSAIDAPSRCPTSRLGQVELLADLRQRPLRLVVKEARGPSLARRPDRPRPSAKPRHKSIDHQLMQHAADAFGGIDTLRNNALAMRMATPLKMPRDDFDFRLTNAFPIGWFG